MAVPFYAECPHCAAQLRINNPQAIGNQVRCPNCQGVFTPEQPPGSFPPPPPARDFDFEEDPDEGYYDEEYEEYDDYDDFDEDEYAPRRGRRGDRSRRSTRNSALVVVLAILGGLFLVGTIGTALLLPAVGKAREAARRSQDKNNLKMVGLAMHNYHDVHGAFPVIREEQDNRRRMPFMRFGPPNRQPVPRNRQLSWRVHLLPFLEQQPLYQQFHLDEPWDSPHNRRLIPHMPDVFKRPGSKAPQGKTTYLGVDGPGTVMENGGGTKFREITDGTSNTILVVEVEDQYAVTWTKPDDYRFDPRNPKRELGAWRGGFHALLCDGSVRFISHEIFPQTLANLFQKNDGQVVGEF